MRTWTITLGAVLLGIVAATSAPSQGAKHSIGVAGNDENIDVRYGRVMGKGEFGPYLTYGDSVVAQGGWTAGGGAYATWDVWDRPMSIIGYEVDGTLYIGGMAGLLNEDDREEERGRSVRPTVSLITGVRIGGADKGVFLAIEGRYGFKAADWSVLTDIDERRTATLNIGYRW